MLYAHGGTYNPNYTDQNHYHKIYRLIIKAITQQIVNALEKELGIPSTDTQDSLVETSE